VYGASGGRLVSVGSPQRIDYLDGLRAVAVLSVVAVHWITPRFDYGQGGYVGVDVFFVISGYIITVILIRDLSHGVQASNNQALVTKYARFLRKRMERLYPALLVFVLATALLFATDSRHLIPQPDVFRNMTVALTQTASLYLMLGTNKLTPFGHTWSLSIEWVFYIVWPLLLWKFRLSGGRARALTPMAAIAAYALSVPLSGHAFYYGPSARIGELLVGCALALYAREVGQLAMRTPRAALRLVSSISIFLYAIFVVWGPVQFEPGFRFVGLPVAVAFSTIVISLGIAGLPSRAIRALATKPLAMVGRASYSLYLWHMAVIDFITQSTFGWSETELAAFGVVVTTLLTATSYFVLERRYFRAKGTTPAKQLAETPTG